MGEPISPRTLSCAGREPRGRKSRRRHCGKAIEAQPSSGQITPSMRPRRVASQTDSKEEDMADMGPRKEAATLGEGVETLTYGKAS
jgi:hypothetical protein